MVIPVLRILSRLKYFLIYVPDLVKKYNLWTVHLVLNNTKKKRQEYILALSISSYMCIRFSVHFMDLVIVVGK